MEFILWMEKLEMTDWYCPVEDCEYSIDWDLGYGDVNALLDIINHLAKHIMNPNY